jgi:hypothetical protein
MCLYGNVVYCMVCFFLATSRRHDETRRLRTLVLLVVAGHGLLFARMGGLAPRSNAPLDFLLAS